MLAIQTRKIWVLSQAPSFRKLCVIVMEDSFNPSVGKMEDSLNLSAGKMEDSHSPRAEKMMDSHNPSAGKMETEGPLGSRPASLAEL